MVDLANPNLADPDLADPNLAGGFVPTDIDGAVLWLRPDEEFITRVSGNVSGVTDRSDSGNHASQDTASLQPGWTESDAAYGNRPTLDMTTGEWMQADSLASQLSGSSGPTPFTCFTVNGWGSTAANRAIFCLGANAVSPYFFLQRQQTSGAADVQVGADGGGTDRALGDAISTDPAVFELTWDGSNVTVLRNGASVGIDSAALSIGASTFSQWTWGAFRRDTVGRGLGAKAAEIVTYDRVLTSDERTQMRDYMTTRYGL